MIMEAWSEQWSHGIMELAD